MSSTNVRKNISKIIEHVKMTAEPFVISRQGKPEVLIIKMPENYNSDFNEITNISSYSPSFEFLSNEPDLYSLKDIIND